FTGMVPDDVFALAVLFAVPGIVIILLGGFLVGFGARYANGCTSGHAISGLANLQASSLVAVIGFFIGGLISAHVLIPWLLE
ncbi:MAG TPA: YeeE/YedE family protein, partial [Gemmatimonadetes bacterium]|nr:YeeE/YedE family protein [Gemmatimonadota bacterium]